MSSALPAVEDKPQIDNLRTRENAFDLLRLFAATVVVVQHANGEFNTDFGWGAAQWFDGVAIFFVMSGMLIYLSAEKVYERTGQWRQFYVNRFLRIAPAIYAFTIAVPLILLLLGAVSVSEIFVPKELAIWVFGNGALLPAYEMPAWSDVGVGAMTWPLYTIPAEVSFYVITPLLVLAARRWGFWAMLAPFLAVGILSAVVFAVITPNGLGPDQTVLSKLMSHSFLHRAAAFGAGIFWARYWPRVRVRGGLVALALVVYAAVQIDGWIQWPPGVEPLLRTAAMSYLVMVVGYGAPQWLVRIPRVVGDLSFGTYVYQYLVINVVLWYGFTTGWWTTPTVVIATWLIAAVSWRLVEKPALRLKRVSLRDRLPG